MKSVLGDVPHPGTQEALALGCSCPVDDNDYGKGFLGGATYPDGRLIFIWDVDCSVHSEILEKYYYEKPLFSQEAEEPARNEEIWAKAKKVLKQRSRDLAQSAEKESNVNSQGHNMFNEAPFTVDELISFFNSQRCLHEQTGERCWKDTCAHVMAAKQAAKELKALSEMKKRAESVRDKSQELYPGYARIAQMTLEQGAKYILTGEKES